MTEGAYIQGAIYMCDPVEQVITDEDRLARLEGLARALFQRLGIIPPDDEAPTCPLTALRCSERTSRPQWTRAGTNR